MTGQPITIRMPIPFEKNVVREIPVGDETLRGALGPADFPRTARVACRAEGAESLVQIDFVFYMATNEEAVPQHNGAVTFYMGKNSGRVLGLEVRVPGEMNRGTVTLEAQVRPSLAQLRTEAEHDVRQGKHQVRRIGHYMMLQDLMPMIDENLRKLRDEQSHGV